LRVSGHGVTLTFPPGWVNVPTTPDEFAKFLRSRAARFPQLRRALKNQAEIMATGRRLAILAYRIDHRGAVTASTNVLILPAAIPPRRLLPHLAGVASRFGGTHQHDSLTTFGTFAAVLVTYTVPAQAGRPAEYGAQAYIHGPSTTPLISVTTVQAGDAAAILRQIVNTLTFN
jgi:hypothetical protein